MKTHFTNCNYPAKLVENIFNKVKSLPRILTNTERNTNENESRPVRMVSTFGCDKELSSLLPFKVEFVKKTGASLDTRLCKSKYISTGPKFGVTSDCNRTKCKTCPYMSNNDKVKGTSGKWLKSGAGNCTTKNCIYFAACELCDRSYVGKTTLMLCGRISEHKSCYNKYRNNKGVLPRETNREEALADRYSLAMHLYNDHKIDTPNGFQSSYRFTILEKCAPVDLDVKEHLWLQRLRTLFPKGLNLYSPLGFPLLQ